MSNVGDLKVWWVAQVPMEPIEIPVPSVEVGALVMNALAEYDAYQFLNNVKPDYCNSGGLVEFDGDDWCDWQCLETFVEDPQENHAQPSLGWCQRLTEKDAQS